LRPGLRPGHAHNARVARRDGKRNTIKRAVGFVEDGRGRLAVMERDEAMEQLDRERPRDT
jgi:hypothetical protein